MELSGAFPAGMESAASNGVTSLDSAFHLDQLLKM
jgi:hypothetical protein